jgi:hypothetical protein
MKNMKKKILVAFLLAAVLALPLVVLAADPPGPIDSGTTVLPNPLGNAVTPAELAGRLIKIILGVSGIAALVVFIYGGLTFMFSGGNSQKVETAKNTLVYAALGLAIIFASYAVLSFVLQALTGATGRSVSNLTGSPAVEVAPSCEGLSEFECIAAGCSYHWEPATGGVCYAPGPANPICQTYIGIEACLAAPFSQNCNWNFTTNECS